MKPSGPIRAPAFGARPSRLAAGFALALGATAPAACSPPDDVSAARQASDPAPHTAQTDAAPPAPTPDSPALAQPSAEAVTNPATSIDTTDPAAAPAAVPTPARPGFADAAEPWPVPRGPLGGGFGATYGETWQTLDLDGDRRPDLAWLGLLRTDTTGVPQIEPWSDDAGPHWRVFRNTGQGFELDATRWALPTDLERTLGHTTLTVFPNDVIDVDGDRRPDLVALGRPWDLAGQAQPWRDAEGHAVWLVFRNTGQGFAAEPRELRLPPALPVTATRGATYLTTDLQGDGLLDLVVLGELAADGSLRPFEDGATRYWRLYRGLPGGFAAEPLWWTLPAALVDGPPWLSAPLDDASWMLADLDGDGRDDLLRTGLPTARGDYEVLRDGGQAHWEVYLNDGTGFAAGFRLRVPDNVDPRGFATSHSVRQPVPAGAPVVASWALQDVDGDAQPELVDQGVWLNSALLAPHGRADETSWKVYAQTTEGRRGFSRQALRWHLPDGVALEPLTAPPMQPTWTAMDLDGDGVLDLVRTGQWVTTIDGPRLETRQSEGRSWWLWHRGSAR